MTEKLQESRKKKILTALQEIEEENDGSITPEMVVEAAKNSNHPLHDEFDWNDKKAAHQHRLNQARNLLRIRIVVKTETSNVRVPMYIRDPEKETNQQGYRQTIKLRDEKSVAIDALRMEFSRAISMMERALKLAEVLDLESEMNDLLSRAKILQMKIA